MKTKEGRESEIFPISLNGLKAELEIIRRQLKKIMEKLNIDASEVETPDISLEEGLVNAVLQRIEYEHKKVFLIKGAESETSYSFTIETEKDELKALYIKISILIDQIMTAY